MTFAVSPNGPKYRQIAGFNGERTVDGSDTRKLSWLVTGATDAENAEAFLLGEGLPDDAIDFTPDGGPTKTVRLQKYNWQEATDGNDTAFIFNAEYAFNKLAVDEYSLSISTGGGSIRVTNSFNTTSYPAPSATAPDFKSAIDVRDGKPQGIDRVLPAVKLTLRYRLTRPVDIFAYTKICSDLTGTVNNDALMGYAAGELLFLGTNGEFGNQKDPELQFDWVASKNADLTIADITSVAKGGHEYLWILYEDEDTGTGGSAYVVQKPRAAYVERIYTEGDHSLLSLTLPS